MSIKVVKQFLCFQSVRFLNYLESKLIINYFILNTGIIEILYSFFIGIQY